MQYFNCYRKTGAKCRSYRPNVCVVNGITAGTLVPSSVNGDIAIQWEWSNFDPSQNPNPLKLPITIKLCTTDYVHETNT